MPPSPTTKVVDKLDSDLRRKRMNLRVGRVTDEPEWVLIRGEAPS